MSNNINEETIVSLNETLLEEVELDAEGLENVRGGALTLTRLGTTTIGQLKNPIGGLHNSCDVNCGRNCFIAEGQGTADGGVFTRTNSSLPGIHVGGFAGGGLTR